jgi:polar amino acid transport system substrate-binding protein
MIKVAIEFIGLLWVAAWAMTPTVTPPARSGLAPTGKLRAGINLENVLLAVKDPSSGEVHGLAVDLAYELGRRIGVPVEILTFETAGRVADAVKTDACDIAFIAAEPTRSAEMTFSPGYVEIEGTYLLPADSVFRTIADVDREGVRIAVAANTAYDLYLTRSLQHARLVRVKGAGSAFNAFVADRLEALAGLRPMLIPYAESLPGARLLNGHFTAIQQAIGISKKRDAGIGYLRAFIEDIKASGWVAQAIARCGVRGLSVSPKAPSP